MALEILCHVVPRHDIADAQFVADFPNATFRKARTLAEVADAIPSADILIASDSLFTAELADIVRSQGTKLRWIQFTTVGTDAAQSFGLPPHILLTNASGMRAKILATHVMALMLGSMRGLRHCADAQRRKEWDRDRIMPTMLSPEDKTLVIVGLGGIGHEVARKAKAFDMRVIGVSRSAQANEHIDVVVPRAELDTVLPEADVVLLSLPLDANTHHILGADEIALLKPTVIVVNIARGGLIDEEALIDALTRRTIAGAALDVAKTEPPAADSPLWTLDNVLLSPHIGGQTNHARKNPMAELIAENLRRFTSGQTLINLVARANPK